MTMRIRTNDDDDDDDDDNDDDDDDDDVITHNNIPSTNHVHPDNMSEHTERTRDCMNLLSNTSKTYLSDAVSLVANLSNFVRRGPGSSS